MSHAEGGTLLFFRCTDEELGDAGRLRAVWLSGHQTPADKAFSRRVSIMSGSNADD